MKSLRDPCPARPNSCLPQGALAHHRFPPGGWVSPWLSPNINEQTLFAVPHTRDVLLYLSAPELTSENTGNVLCFTAFVLQHSPPESGWALLTCTHTRCPLVTLGWEGGGDISPTAAHPPQVADAMKALRSFLLVGAHPPRHVESFSSSPDLKGSFKFGLSP